MQSEKNTSEISQLVFDMQDDIGEAVAMARLLYDRLSECEPLGQEEADGWVRVASTILQAVKRTDEAHQKLFVLTCAAGH
jgi:hypothetical protein